MVDEAGAAATRVVIAETGQVIDGPTAVGAPFLASDLIATALATAPGGATVRVEMAVRALLTFSFELRAPVVERLAALGAALEVCINADQPRLTDLACYQDGVHLVVWTGDRDPHEVTARTGVTPTAVFRVGDRLDDRGGKVVQRASWRLDDERAPAVEPSRLVDALCDRWSPAAADACRDHGVDLRFTFMIERLAGGLRFEPGALARLAALRVPLACYFYNVGA